MHPSVPHTTATAAGPVRSPAASRAAGLRTERRTCDEETRMSDVGLDGSRSFRIPMRSAFPPGSPASSRRIPAVAMGAARFCVRNRGRRHRCGPSGNPVAAIAEQSRCDRARPKNGRDPLGGGAHAVPSTAGPERSRHRRYRRRAARPTAVPRMKCEANAVLIDAAVAHTGERTAKGTRERSERGTFSPTPPLAKRPRDFNRGTRWKHRTAARGS